MRSVKKSNEKSFKQSLTFPIFISLKVLIIKLNFENGIDLILLLCPGEMKSEINIQRTIIAFTQWSKKCKCSLVDNIKLTFIFEEVLFAYIKREAGHR